MQKSKVKLQTNLLPAHSQRSYKNNMLPPFTLSLRKVNDDISFALITQKGRIPSSSSSSWFLWLSKRRGPNVFAVMRRISVLIIKRRGWQLCRQWVCFFALHCPVQRWIIIMLPCSGPRGRCCVLLKGEWRIKSAARMIYNVLTVERQGKQLFSGEYQWSMSMTPLSSRHR